MHTRVKATFWLFLPLMVLFRPFQEAPPSEGPWLLVIADEGVYVHDVDGSNPRRLSDKSGYVLPEISLEAGFTSLTNVFPSPEGGYAAIVQVEDTETLQGIKLQLISLPTGIIETITPLIAPEFDQPEGLKGYERQDFARRALTTSPVWSPDGKRLAFLAGLENPSFDLYVYDLQSGYLLRLTDGTIPLWGFSWAPDGEHLLFWDSASLNPTTGVVPADGSTPAVLFPDLFPNAQGEFLGWLDVHTYALYARNAEGRHNLRALDVTTGEEKVVWEGRFDSLAYDPADRLLAVCVSEDTAQINQQPVFGVFIINPLEPAGTQEAVNCLDIAWQPHLNAFTFFTDQGAYQVAPGGSSTEFNPDATPILKSPNGGWQYSILPAEDFNILLVTTSPEGEWKQVYAGPVLTEILWRVDDEGIFLLNSDSQLSYLPAPSFTPVEIGGNIQHVAWVP